MTVQGMTLKMSMTPVEIDLGDSSTAMLTTVDMSASGGASQTTGSVYVSGNGSTMSLSQIGGTVDEASLKELATTAYNKAKPVLG